MSLPAGACLKQAKVFRLRNTYRTSLDWQRTLVNCWEQSADDLSQPRPFDRKRLKRRTLEGLSVILTFSPYVVYRPPAYLPQTAGQAVHWDSAVFTGLQTDLAVELCRLPEIRAVASGRYPFIPTVALPVLPRFRGACAFHTGTFRTAYGLKYFQDILCCHLI